jgi:multiple sugar transport system substrate-binding protein
VGKEFRCGGRLESSPVWPSWHARSPAPDWLRQSYIDTFTNLATGTAAMQYQAHGRGAGYIERTAPAAIADPGRFAVTEKVVGPSGKAPSAHLDSEPWMIFKHARNPEAAVEFLKFFYREENYIPYLHSVPIHLLPVTRSTYKHPRYLEHPTIRKWRPWVDMQEAYFLTDRARPALVVDWADLRRPYLLDVLESGIVADMVYEAVKGVPSTEAAARAQRRVEDLLRGTTRTR